MNEIWKPIPKYEGYYEASNLGEIRSLSHKNRYKRYNRIKLLKPALSKDGYLRVVLCVDRKRETLNVHRLVLSAFSEDKTDLQVNHINGVKSDNRVENLEWCTQSENMLHAYRIGLETPCDNGLKKSITMLKDGNKGNSYPSIREMCRVEKMDRRSVQRVIDGIHKNHHGFTFLINE